MNFKVETSLLGGNNVSDKSDMRFRFTQSSSGSISGIAFKKDGGIVASFKLDVERNSVCVQGKSWSSTTLTMVCQATGVKIYMIFDEILSKYGEKDSRCQTGRAGRICSHWRIYNDRVKTALSEIKETLEK